MRILVAGSGAMGTAMAGLLSSSNEVSLWGRRLEHCDSIRKTRENLPHLPGYLLPSAVEVLGGPLGDLDGHDCLLLAVPTQHIRAICAEQGLARFRGPVISAAKGLELGSFLTPCRILSDAGIPMERLYALSGPSHAEEMCRGVPTTLVLAGCDLEGMKTLTPVLSGPTLRVYYSQDQLGVELSGALKNIIAIAAGMADGLGFGMNTKSAIVTRGLAEIRKYGVMKGARSETFYGLSGLGDLVTTCCSSYSRNRAFGEAQVRNPAAFDLGQRLAEGAYTVRSLMEELRGGSFEMPLCRAVYEVTCERKNPREVLKQLLNRPLKEED